MIKPSCYGDRLELPSQMLAVALPMRGGPNPRTHGYLAPHGYISTPRFGDVTLSNFRHHGDQA